MTKEKALGIEYYVKRKKAGALRYRLERRTNEILTVIKKYEHAELGNLLDVGCADGLMLEVFGKKLDISLSVGMDLSYELLKANPTGTIKFIQGNALDLPLRDQRFDLVVTSAVIEHVSDAEKMLKECRRVLRENGLLILTSPVPFWESVATKIGHLKREDHYKTFNLSELRLLFLSQGFKIIKTEKFMISPIGFPFEPKIERLMKWVKINFFLLNQLIVGRRKISL